jgi:hypothetical protein
MNCLRFRTLSFTTNHPLFSIHHIKSCGKVYTHTQTISPSQEELNDISENYFKTFAQELATTAVTVL